MPKAKTKSKHAPGAKAKAERVKSKRQARGAKAKTEDGKGLGDEVVNPKLDCRLCDFTSESEKILKKHIRSEHAAGARQYTQPFYSIVK